MAQFMILEANMPSVNHLGETVCLIVAWHLSGLPFRINVKRQPARHRHKFPAFGHLRWHCHRGRIASGVMIKWCLQKGATRFRRKLSRPKGMPGATCP